MKKQNKKRGGFTIVELIVVIAVIAILATVLVPTFSGVLDKANESTVIQNARNFYIDYVANLDYINGEASEQNVVIKVEEDKYVAVANGEIVNEVFDDVDEAKEAANGATVVVDMEETEESVSNSADSTAQ